MKPKILHITSELDGGGVDRLLFDYCKRLQDDYLFDFAVTSSFEGMLERPLSNLGCNIFHITPYRKSVRRHKEDIAAIMKYGHYDIVHDHGGYKAAINLKVAANMGVRGRIAHAHIASVPETVSERLIRTVSTLLTKHYATDLFACGRDAASWMWGTSSDAFIMTNAIDAKSFSFSEEARVLKRRELGLDNSFVVGNVARFSVQKNHSFLLNSFKEVLAINPRAVLLLVGRGELEDSIRYEAIKTGVIDRVLFLGVREDVPELLSAMDVFVLPSFFEGLPVTMVEVQANGLPVVLSDAITKEICLASNIVYLSLNEAPAVWAKTICASKNRLASNSIMGGSYDIEFAVSELDEKYSAILA